jgi:hypothetical protein
MLKLIRFPAGCLLSTKSLEFIGCLESDTGGGVIQILVAKRL